MIALWLGLALAGEPARPIAPLDIRYPPHSKALRLDGVRCEVHTQIDPRGVPRDISVTGCPPAFAVHTRKQVQYTRFTPATEAGEAVAGGWDTEVHYRWPGPPPTRSPEEWQAVVARYEPLTDGSDTGSCRVHVSVDSSGEPVRLASNRVGECLAVPRPQRGPPERAFVDGPVRCTVSFVALQGVTGRVDASDCPVAVRPAVRRLVDRWAWDTWTDRPHPYRLSLEFTAEDASGPAPGP